MATGKKKRSCLTPMRRSDKWVGELNWMAAIANLRATTGLWLSLWTLVLEEDISEKAVAQTVKDVVRWLGLPESLVPHLCAIVIFDLKQMPRLGVPMSVRRKAHQIFMHKRAAFRDAEDVSALREALREEAQASKRQSGRHHEGMESDVSSRGTTALFIGISERRLNVSFEGIEDVTFRGCERLFCLLLRLAAARKTGSGWLHKERQLHEMKVGTQTFYELKNHLTAVTRFNEILKADDRGEGMVRIELRRDMITISKSICDFESRHLDHVRGIVEEIPPGEDLRADYFDGDDRRVVRESLGLARNSLLIAEAARDLGWRLKNKECLKVVEAFLSCIPSGISYQAYFVNVRELYEQLRDVLS